MEMLQAPEQSDSIAAPALILLEDYALIEFVRMVARRGAEIRAAHERTALEVGNETAAAGIEAGCAAPVGVVSESIEVPITIDPEVCADGGTNE